MSRELSTRGGKEERVVSSLNHDLDAVDLNALELLVEYAGEIVK